MTLSSSYESEPGRHRSGQSTSSAGLGSIKLSCLCDFWSTNKILRGMIVEGEQVLRELQAIRKD